MKFQGRSVSNGGINGRVVWNLSKRLCWFPRRRIVVLDDLNVHLSAQALKCAGGIIAEQGGLTSHGAILAREFSIPAMILPGAKKFLKPGIFVSFNSSGVIKADLPALHVYRKRQTFRPVKQSRWLLYRPRQYQLMRNSLTEDGVRSIPRVMWDVSMDGDYRQDARGYWLKNHPTPKAVVDRILAHPSWLKGKLKNRSRVFDKVKKHLTGLIPALQKGITIDQAALWLRRTKNILTQMRPYTNLISTALDEAEDRLNNMLASLPPDEIIHCFDVLTRTTFGEALRSKRIVINARVHHFRFPSPPIPRVAFFRPRRIFRPRCSSPTTQAWLKKQPSYQQKKIKRMTELVMLFSELNEWSTYYYIAVIDCANILLDKIAKFLTAKKEIKVKEEIFDMHVNQVMTMLEDYGIKTNR